MPRSDCITWDGPKRKDGYGRVFINGKRFYAHRVAYCEANNLSLLDIEGLVVRHDCDNPSCVNPKHLLIGTHADNVWDKIERHRDPKGERHGMAKLTEPQVADIRSRDLSARGSTVALAREFSVSHTVICNIKSKKIWKWVEAA